MQQNQQLVIFYTTGKREHASANNLGGGAKISAHVRATYIYAILDPLNTNIILPPPIY